MPTQTKAAAPKAAQQHKHADLEKKIADLEKKLAALTKTLADHEKKSESEHAALAAKCEACCAASAGGGGKDVHLRQELKRWFETYGNRHVPTHKPDLD